MIVLVISLWMQFKIMPYAAKDLNELEIRSILVSCITIYAGLYYLTGNLSSIPSTIFFGAIVFINLYFIIYWVILMLKVYLMIAIQKIPFL